MGVAPPTIWVTGTTGTLPVPTMLMPGVVGASGTTGARAPVGTIGITAAAVCATGMFVAGGCTKGTNGICPGAVGVVGTAIFV
ncbi:Hypothetical protein HVR_LOCUS17 [uncultured virus]|nr:Hypothetical protein HVR_LOCUS17 [uncultured virus]